MMLTTSHEPDILQYGAYTRQQASLISRVHPRTVSYWFDGDLSRGPAIQLHMPENDRGLISFVDLIQLLGVHAIRSKHKVSLQKIREAVKNAEQLGVTFPFARNSAKAFLWNDRIVLRHHACQLGHGLDEQHARHQRFTRKMTTRPRFVATNQIFSDALLPGHQARQAVHEPELRAVGQRLQGLL